MELRRFAGAAGIGFVAMIVLSLVLGGSPPDADAPAQEVADYFADHQGALKAGVSASALALLLAVVFAAA